MKAITIKLLILLVLIALVVFAYWFATAQVCVDRRVAIPGDDGCYYLWERFFNLRGAD